MNRHIALPESGFKPRESSGTKVAQALTKKKTDSLYFEQTEVIRPQIPYDAEKRVQQIGLKQSSEKLSKVIVWMEIWTPKGLRRGIHCKECCRTILPEHRRENWHAPNCTAVELAAECKRLRRVS